MSEFFEISIYIIIRVGVGDFSDHLLLQGKKRYKSDSENIENIRVIFCASCCTVKLNFFAKMPRRHGDEMVT
jgi:hypothetical protein